MVTVIRHRVLTLYGQHHTPSVVQVLNVLYKQIMPFGFVRQYKLCLEVIQLQERNIVSGDIL